MNVLVVGDLHLSEKTPENRLDDFAITSLSKLKFLLNTAAKEKCELMLTQ